MMDNPCLRSLVKSVHGIDSDEAMHELVCTALAEVRTKLCDAQDILAVLGLWALTLPKSDPCRKRLDDIGDLLTDVAKALKDALTLKEKQDPIPF